MCAGPLPRRSIPTSLNKKTMECCGTKDIQPYNHVILEKIKVIKLISSPKRVNITLPEDQYQNFEKSFPKYRNPKHA